jgi:pimeloyl-ACP methyl ester carboxylesterase
MSTPGVYAGLRGELMRRCKRLVWVAPAKPYEWIAMVSRQGWSRPLDVLDETVRRAVQSAPGGKITLIAHSVGGLLARLYLSDRPFRGRIYAGRERVEHVITLGSPHFNRGGLMRGGPLARWVEAELPGAFYAPEVRYTSVAGKWLRGTHFGPLMARLIYDIYDEIGGDGRAWGDGIVPVESALLSGAEHVILEGVSHFPYLTDRWYGSPEVIHSWLDNECNHQD